MNNVSLADPGKWQIEKSSAADVQTILRLYQHARNYQKEKGAVQWPQFEPAMVEVEIREGRQWKLVNDDVVVCIWVIAFDDAQIWEEQNNDPALYIHRIATHPAYRGQNAVSHIVTWAKAYAAQKNKQFIRLDTAGNNQGLISYYCRQGFKFLGMRQLRNTVGLPAHYHAVPICLFEINLIGKDNLPAGVG